MSSFRIGLSFDDGPSNWTAPILDLLRDHDARATFFLIGSLATSAPEIVQRIQAEGHEIGNHTWSHPALTRGDDEDVRAELVRTSEAIERITGGRPTLFRAPRYERDDRVDGIAAELGLRHARGDVIPPDWHPQATARLIATFVLQGIAPNAIVGLHDGVPPQEDAGSITRQPTVDALAAVLPVLAQREVQCVTVSEAITG